MQLFSNYIQELTSWLTVHPYWALFFTFFISLCESLAVIGSIVPGSITMTGIGILVGSGIMRLDLTLLAATLGAIAGDSSSYLLGYLFKDKLPLIWPFRNYPNLFTYGKSYFERHGGKSVLIGRFVGPLRALIPLIAGMMHMPQWQFFIANVLSGFAWSLLYILPGVLIGSASHELSPEIASRLFALVLIFLGFLWLLSAVIKWIVIHLNRFLRSQLYDFVSWSGKHPRLAKVIQPLIPSNENNPYKTTELCLSFILSLVFFLGISTVVAESEWIMLFNQPIYLFLQSLRINSLDTIFILMNAFISQFTLIALFAYLLVMSLYYKDWKMLGYWLALHLSCTLILFLLYALLNSLGLDLSYQKENTYPAIRMSFASCQFFFLMFYHYRYYPKSFLTKLLGLMLPTILVMVGVGAVYLGDHWITDVLGAYSLGLTLSLFFWIAYRRHQPKRSHPYLGFGLLSLVGLSFLSAIYFNFEHERKAHQPFLAKYIFSEASWWSQTKNLLPLYRTNRIGNPVNIFNIQYVGPLSYLEQALVNYGWHKEKDSLFASLIKRMNDKNPLISQSTPLMSQLYLNRKPVLIMAYTPTSGKYALIMRLWRSNFFLSKFPYPIWLGTLTPYSLKSNSKNASFEIEFKHITKGLSGFSLKEILIHPTEPEFVTYPNQTKILLIRAKNSPN